MSMPVDKSEIFLFTTNDNHSHSLTIAQGARIVNPLGAAALVSVQAHCSASTTECQQFFLYDGIINFLLKSIDACRGCATMRHTHNGRAGNDDDD